jgi:uncharacterized protein YvpB
MPVLKNFPYFSQRDNQFNPSGSCNVTSIAMSLYFLGVRGDTSYPQLEDQLYTRCTAKGWSRHDPCGLKQLVESYPNCKDDLTTNGTLRDIRDAIDKGIPCVLHGYFTRFGHIVVVKGYDNHDRSFIVNDPYGEWNDWGYDTSVSGEGLHYSASLISRLCSPESIANPSNIWLHRIRYESKKSR